MEGTNIPVLPSVNSAFVKPERFRKLNTSPSISLRKRLLFEPSPHNGNEVKKRFCEATRNNQTVFAARWRCNCDVISRCCEEHIVSQKRNFNIPTYDWVPICKATEETPSLLKRYQLTAFNMKANLRPESPVPFMLPHFRENTSSSPVSFCEHSDRICKNDDSSRELSKHIPNCLTPPTSPEQKHKAPSETIQLRSRNPSQINRSDIFVSKNSSNQEPKCHSIRQTIRSDQTRSMSQKRKDMSP